MSTTNMFRDAAEFMSEQRHDSTTQEITYSRDSETPLTINATVGRVSGDEISIDEHVIDGDQVDFIIRRADLDFGAGAVDPEYGDTIELDNGSRVLAYTVRPDATDSAFRPCDEYGFDLRIHTEKTGDVAS